MIKVLHIVSSLSKNSGVTCLMMSFLREIDKDKYSFDFAYFNETQNDTEIKNQILTLGGQYFKITKLNFFNCKALNVEIDRLLKNNKYDYIHCHESILVNFIYHTVVANKVKLIVHSHSSQLSNSLIGIIRNRLMVLGIKNKSDIMLSCSKEAGEYLFGSREFTESGIVIPNGIDFEKFKYSEEKREKIRTKYKINSEEFVLGTIGRCDKIKNQRYLLLILKSVLNKDKNMKLLLVGDGNELNMLKKFAIDNGIKDNCLFVGTQTNVNDYLCAMDVFLFPSKKEGFGVAIVEAQACGLPCIASLGVPSSTRISRNYWKIRTDSKSIVKWVNKIITIKNKKISRDYHIDYNNKLYIKNSVKLLEDVYLKGLN